MKNQPATRKIAVTAVFGALSALLMFLEFSVPLMPGFIKLDFSDLPALIAAFAYGPLSGVVICFMKNLIHLLFSGTLGVGELSNFILSGIYAAVAGLVYRRFKTRRGALLGSLAGAAASAVLGVFSNYFLVYPLYAKLLMPVSAILGMYRTILPGVQNLFMALLIFNLPFTFVKGVLVAAICFAVYKPLRPILKGRA